MDLQSPDSLVLGLPRRGPSHFTTWDYSTPVVLKPKRYGATINSLLCFNVVV
jgi:hypothetical protein